MFGLISSQERKSSRSPIQAQSASTELSQYTSNVFRNKTSFRFVPKAFAANHPKNYSRPGRFLSMATLNFEIQKIPSNSIQTAAQVHRLRVLKGDEKCSALLERKKENNSKRILGKSVINSKLLKKKPELFMLKKCKHAMLACRERRSVGWNGLKFQNLKGSLKIWRKTSKSSKVTRSDDERMTNVTSRHTSQTALESVLLECQWSPRTSPSSRQLQVFGFTRKDWWKRN